MTDSTTLIDAYMDESLTPAEAELLRDWLKESDANVDHFAREVFFHRRLHDLLHGQGIMEIEGDADWGHDGGPGGGHVVDPRAGP